MLSRNRTDDTALGKIYILLPVHHITGNKADGQWSLYYDYHT